MFELTPGLRSHFRRLSASNALTLSSISRRSVTPLSPTMPCAAGELCQIPDRTPESHNGHECRGGCGGRLHGLCGELEEPGGGSDNPMHRICASCADRNRKAAAYSSSSATKRKTDTVGRGEDAAKKPKTPASGGASGKSRVRLSHGQKMDVLGLLKQRVSHAQIAHRFGCGERTVSNIAQQRKQLEEEDKAAGCDQSAKSRRKGYFPKVNSAHRCTYCTVVPVFCRLYRPKHFLFRKQ